MPRKLTTKLFQILLYLNVVICTGLEVRPILFEAQRVGDSKAISISPDEGLSQRLEPHVDNFTPFSSWGHFYDHHDFEGSLDNSNKHSKSLEDKPGGALESSCDASDCPGSGKLLLDVLHKGPEFPESMREQCIDLETSLHAYL